MAQIIEGCGGSGKSRPEFRLLKYVSPEKSEGKAVFADEAADSIQEGRKAAKLSELLRIQRGVTSLIGSGGKTTMLHVLAAELSARGSVILTTSTHIRPSELFPCLFSPTAEAIRAALAKTPVVCVGSLTPEGKFTACALSFETLAGLADYVLVEADGSKRLPLKAHADYEPVIPENSGKTVCLVGASGLGRPIREVVHRPEIFCSLSETAPEQPATPKAVACVLNREALADEYYVNQYELPDARKQADSLAALLKRPTFCGSLQTDYEGSGLLTRKGDARA